jgi:hypothetical protein
VGCNESGVCVDLIDTGGVKHRYHIMALEAADGTLREGGVLTFFYFCVFNGTVTVRLKRTSNSVYIVF